MSNKDNFDKESKKVKRKLNQAIENTDNQEEIDALESAKEDLDDTIELSEESEAWIKRQEEQSEKINEWRKETEYEYRKNVDIINDTLNDRLRDSVEDWYENFNGDDIINKESLKDVVEEIKYDLMMEEVVELETTVTKTTQDLSGNQEYCVWVDYKFRMDEHMAMHKKWKFDITDVVRWKKMNWLFD